MKINYFLLYTLLITLLSAGSLTLLTSFNFGTDRDEIDAEKRKLLRATDLATKNIQILESHLKKLTKALNSYNPVHSNQNIELTPKYEASEINLLVSEQQQLIIHPTAEERQSYYDLVSYLENPRFVESLNLAELKKMDEMQLIPETLRMVIISRAIELYNRGAINENIFLSGTPGYPQ